MAHLGLVRPDSLLSWPSCADRKAYLAWAMKLEQFHTGWSDSKD